MREITPRRNLSGRPEPRPEIYLRYSSHRQADARRFPRSPCATCLYPISDDAEPLSRLGVGKPSCEGLLRSSVSGRFEEFGKVARMAMVEPPAGPADCPGRVLNFVPGVLRHAPFGDEGGVSAGEVLVAAADRLGVVRAIRNLVGVGLTFVRDSTCRCRTDGALW